MTKLTVKLDKGDIQQAVVRAICQQFPKYEIENLTYVVKNNELEGVVADLRPKRPVTTD